MPRADVELFIEQYFGALEPLWNRRLQSDPRSVLRHARQVRRIAESFFSMVDPHTGRSLLGMGDEVLLEVLIQEVESVITRAESVVRARH